MNRLFERSARLRSRLSARRNIGSGRSPCPSIGEPFLDSRENRAFTAGNPMVFVTMGKIDATLRKCSELLECLELQGIAARAITRNGPGLVGGNPHDADLYLAAAGFCTSPSRPLVGAPSGTLFRVSTISRPSRATVAEGGYSIGIGTETHHRKASFGEFDGQWEADVPLTDNRESRGARRDPTAQRHLSALVPARGVRHVRLPPSHSTVTLLARFRGWSTSQPLRTPTW